MKRLSYEFCGSDERFCHGENFYRHRLEMR